jgi:argininosuccinate lyase
MDKLTTEQLQGVDNRFGADVLDVFNYERSVEMKSAIGGTCKSAIKEQIMVLKSIIE